MRATTSTYTVNSTNDRFSIGAMIGAALRAIDQFSPRTAEVAAANLFLTPRKIRRPAREAAWISPAERFDVVTERGHRIAQWVWGEADRGTVLLVHGWEGRASQLGAFAEPLVSAGFRVVAIDLPSHGESKGHRTNLLECAGVVEDIANTIGPLEAIVAHSFGSAATTVALSRGVQSRRAVFISPANDYSYFADAFGSILRLGPTMPRRIQREIEGRLGVEWDSLQPDRLAKQIACSVLVIHDEFDREVPLAQGLKVARVWPGAAVIQTRGLGHRRILRAPEVVKTTTGFIAPDAISRTAVA